MDWEKVLKEADFLYQHQDTLCNGDGRYDLLSSHKDPYDYSVSHTYHHRYTMYPDADRENLLPLKPSLSPLLILQLFTINLFGKTDRVFSKGGLFSTIQLTYLSAIGKTGSTKIPS